MLTSITRTLFSIDVILTVIRANLLENISRKVSKLSVFIEQNVTLIRGYTPLTQHGNRALFKLQHIKHRNAMKLNRILTPNTDRLNAIRRKLWQWLDQLTATSLKRIKATPQVDIFQPPTKFSLVTVNFSTTYYLKLMLLTLCQQKHLTCLSKIVIVDNNSKDGGIDFLQKLEKENKNIYLVRNNSNLTHANGLRKGIAFIDELEKDLDQQKSSNALLICDSDIVFRNPQTLEKLATLLAKEGNAFVGELRYGLYPYPEAQASFFAIRRDCYAQKDIAPLVHHGAPAYFMQRSIWRSELKLVDFPSNQGGYILHRGRSGVAAANRYHIFNAFATASNNNPHYMGVENGEKIWAKIENRYKSILHKSNESELLNYLHSNLQNISET